MNKIYLASSVEDKSIVKKIDEQIKEYNIEVIFKWWEFYPNSELDKENHINHSIKAIKECDLFVLYNSFNSKKTSGKYIELGIAIALNKPILCIGHITSIFKYSILSSIGQFSKNIPEKIFTELKKCNKYKVIKNE